jgi:hypothetical protein
LEQDGMTPVSLAEAIEQTSCLKPMLPINLQGAHNSALLLRQWLTDRKQSN